MAITQTPVVFATRDSAAVVVPSATPDLIPLTLTSEDQVTAAAAVQKQWMTLRGVTGVDMVNVIWGGVYGEVRVERGMRSAETANLLWLLSGASDNFSVILYDDDLAVDYVWDAEAQVFRETPLSIRPPTYTPSAATPVAPTASVELPYTVLAFANVRGCTSTDCALIVSLTGGTVVTVTGQEAGADVGGSTLWYAVRLQDGRAGYVHSSLVGAGVIVVSTPAPAVVGGGSTSVPVVAPVWVCQGDQYNCSDFKGNRDLLMSYWTACPGDPSNLDGNPENGIPCDGSR
jgi:hypothetical protein